MPRCPHCGANTIGPFSKFWSDAACPVHCQSCGGLAYLESSHTQILNAIVFPGSLIALAAATITNSLLPLFALFALWLLAFAHVIWRAPLTPISENQAASNKRWRNAVLLLLRWVRLFGGEYRVFEQRAGWGKLAHNA